MDIIFNDNDLVEAYDGKVELSFPNGLSYHNDEIILFIGPNGIGKSTLAKILTNFISYKILKGNDFNRNFLFHPQNSLFLPGTLEEDYNVFLQKFEYDDKILNTKKMKVFYDERKNQNIANLSGGEKQLLLLLRTMLIYKEKKDENNIDGIVLDEPSKQLDNENFQTLESVFLKKLSTFTKPIFFISHDFNLIQAIFRVFLPKNKKIKLVEIKEIDSKRREVLQLDVFDITDIEKKWPKLINISEYLSAFFGHQEAEIKPIGNLNNDLDVMYTIPFHSGLFKIKTNQNNWVITGKPKNSSTTLLSNEQICFLD